MPTHDHTTPSLAHIYALPWYAPHQAWVALYDGVLLTCPGAP